jgi:hypothetical protein
MVQVCSESIQGGVAMTRQTRVLFTLVVLLVIVAACLINDASRAQQREARLSTQEKKDLVAFLRVL